MHIGFILDGNGRWALTGFAEVIGHKRGAENVEIILRVFKTNIQHVTLYAFSTENWQNPYEVKALMSL